MNPAILLLLLCLPAPAQGPDPEELKSRFLEKGAEEPILLALEPELSRLPLPDRLRLAEELSVRRSGSVVLKAALAKALCAAGRKPRAVRLLRRVRLAGASPDVRQFTASAWAECGEPARAAAVLAGIIDAAAFPADAVSALAAWLRLGPQGAAPAVLSSWKSRWRRQASRAGPARIRSLRLLAEVYQWEKDPALEPLCRDAIRLFPYEASFYDLLVRRLSAAGDWDGAQDLRMRQVSSLASVRAADYLNLAEVFVSSGRIGEAAARLRPAREDARLIPDDRALLEDKRALLEAVARAHLPPSASEACGFQDEAGSFSVDCGGARLAFDSASGRLSGERDPARAAALAARLLEHAGRERFSAQPEAPPIPPEARELLKAAGYLDR